MIKYLSTVLKVINLFVQTLKRKRIHYLHKAQVYVQVYIKTIKEYIPW